MQGKKVCAHVHHCIPYLLVDMPHDVRQEQQVAFLQHLGSTIEDLVEKQMNKNNGTQRKWAPQVVHDAWVVRGVPFYGFCAHERLFIKLYVYNPHYVSKIAAILLNGMVQVC